MADVKLKLSPPWCIYMSKLNALFGNDPKITVEFDEKNYEVRLFVDDGLKAEAISKLIPTVKKIGNIDLKIYVVPSNGEIGNNLDDASAKEIFDTAFEGNPVYAYAQEVEVLYCYTVTYIVFKNKVVQFFGDNLSDIHGLISTLYQDIAYEIFEDAGLNDVYYCTDIEEKVAGMPLNWL